MSKTKALDEALYNLALLILREARRRRLAQRAPKPTTEQPK